MRQPLPPQPRARPRRPTTPGPSRPGTRERLITAGVSLFKARGLNGTGVKEILDRADARFSSLYHYFPGGKDELAAVVIARAGAEYQLLVEAVWDSEHDVVSGVRKVFEGAADLLESTDYADACPVAAVALEVASSNEELRLATSEVFDAWIDSASSRLVDAGATAGDARTLAHSLIALLEGAFVLCRAGRRTEPMRDAAGVAATLVRQAVPG
ncbi:MAG TPA: TetR/AcrR family transcriptional regulator [Acidimicrobiales bacterium]|nr:TetR/AcrR family transcriptional regulator [Acidimicrobiales bacterium]